MGCLWIVIKPLAILAVFVALGSVAAFPWAIPLPGRETLTGNWVGNVRSTKGPRAWLHMNVDLAPGYRPRLFAGRTRLGGDAALCTDRRRIDLYITGYTTAWNGKSVDLLLRPVKPSPPELRFDVLGTWDGHTLELRQSDRSLAETLNEPGGVAAGESQSSSQWIATTLRRGTTSGFDSACATLGGRK